MGAKHFRGFSSLHCKTSAVQQHAANGGEVKVHVKGLIRARDLKGPRDNCCRSHKGQSAPRRLKENKDREGGTC